MNNSKEDTSIAPVPADAAALAAARDEAALWQSRAAYLQTQAQRAEQECGKYQEQVLTLEAQLRALEAYAAELKTSLDHAQAALEMAQRTTAPLPSAATAVGRPAITDIVEQLPRSADPGNQYARRSLAQIRFLVLHHTGSDDPAITPQELAELHVKDPKHQWPGIGFHYFISADGTIYQTNRLETVCYHVVNNNPTSVGIVLSGRFSDAMPTAAQIESAAGLVAWLLQELRLPPESVVGHREFADQQTDCPGSTWPAWKEILLDKVRRSGQMTRRPIYHYVLFWQTDTAWAEAEWQAAMRYIARFRPTVGFSPQEARQAENVTIIGGPTGVSPEVEDMLHAAGCRVQRIAGKNMTQTRALLDAMARDGQRFLPTSSVSTIS